MARGPRAQRAGPLGGDPEGWWSPDVCTQQNLQGMGAGDQEVGGGGVSRHLRLSGNLASCLQVGVMGTLRHGRLSESLS